VLKARDRAPLALPGPCPVAQLGELALPSTSSSGAFLNEAMNFSTTTA